MTDDIDAVCQTDLANGWLELGGHRLGIERVYFQGGLINIKCTTWVVSGQVTLPAHLDGTVCGPDGLVVMPYPYRHTCPVTVAAGVVSKLPGRLTVFATVGLDHVVPPRE